MKVVLGVLGALVVVAVAGLGFGYWILSGAPSFAPPPARTPAPAGFEAAAFPDVGALAERDGLRVVDLSDYGSYVEHYFLPDEQVTYFILFSDDERRTTVFVDRTGRVIGEIKQPMHGFPMGPHFVDIDGSYTVSAESVGPFVPHEVIEGDMTADRLATLHAEATRYRRFGFSDVDRDRPEYAEKRDTHVFLIDGVWRKFVGNSETAPEWKGVPFGQLETQYHVRRTPKPRHLEMFYDGKYTLRLTHFDQQDYVGKRGAVMGSPTGQGRSAQWLGTGYYTLTAGETELRFSIVNDAEVLSGGGPVFLTLQGGPELDMVVLKYNRSPRDNAVYVIAAD